MTTIHIREGENLEEALRRFKRECERAGILRELRRREHYTPPSVQRQIDIKEARRRARRKGRPKRRVEAVR